MRLIRDPIEQIGVHRLAELFFGGPRESFAKSCRPAVVHLQHRVSSVREELNVGAEFPFVPVAPRASMYEHHERQSSRSFARRKRHVSCNRKPIARDKSDRSHLREAIPLQPRPRLVELLESAALFRKEIRDRRSDRRMQCHHPARPVSGAVAHLNNPADSSCRIKQTLHVGRLRVQPRRVTYIASHQRLACQIVENDLVEVALSERIGIDDCFLSVREIDEHQATQVGSLVTRGVELPVRREVQRRDSVFHGI